MNIKQKERVKKKIVGYLLELFRLLNLRSDSDLEELKKEWKKLNKGKPFKEVEVSDGK